MKPKDILKDLEKDPQRWKAVIAKSRKPVEGEVIWERSSPFLAQEFRPGEVMEFDNSNFQRQVDLVRRQHFETLTASNSAFRVGKLYGGF